MNKLQTLTENDLHAYLKRIDLVEKTAQQIIRDFEIYNFQIEFSGIAGTAYNELFSQIKPCIEKLFSDDYQKLLQVLYHIDVNEKKVNEALKDNKNVCDLITELIIMRELQKVVTREFFRVEKK